MNTRVPPPATSAFTPLSELHIVDQCTGAPLAVLPHPGKIGFQISLPNVRKKNWTKVSNGHTGELLATFEYRGPGGSIRFFPDQKCAAIVGVGCHSHPARRVGDGQGLASKDSPSRTILKHCWNKTKALVDPRARIPTLPDSIHPSALGQS